MRRYSRSRRTQSGIIETNALRDQFIRQLTREGEAVLKQLSEQFTQSLSTQLSQITQAIVPGDTPNAPSANSNTPEAGSIASFGQLLSTGVRYLVSRPRTSHTTVETSRSGDAATQFRSSRSQQAAEMQVLMGLGNRNG